MPAEDKGARQGTTATVVATAAVTLAIGVTVAALGGYLHPSEESPSQQVTATEPSSSPPPEQAAPAVVLVPVTPHVEEPSRHFTREIEPEPVFVDYRTEPREHGGDERDDDEYEHRGRDHDDDEHEHEQREADDDD